MLLVGHDAVPDPLKNLRIKGLKREMGVGTFGFHRVYLPEIDWFLLSYASEAKRGPGLGAPLMEGDFCVKLVQKSMCFVVINQNGFL